MNREGQERIRSMLEVTLEDERLSRGESQALAAVVDDLTADPTALAFVRNEAFRLARARIEENPRTVLAWLERVDRIVDSAVRGPGGAVVADRVAFSPGDACRKLLRSSLKGAQRTLDVCVFTITDDRITDILLALHARGVAIRVITDDEKSLDPGSDIRRLGEAGIAVRMDETPDHMHHKFAVVDGRLLINGSYNWTRSATGNQENLHTTAVPGAVEPFRRRFETLWREFAPR